MPKDKIQPIHAGWDSKAALHDVLNLLKDKKDSQVLIIIRESPNHTSTYRAANLTNAESNFLVDEFKHNSFNDFYKCKCER